MNSNRITAVFSGHQEAESAVAELRRLGVRDDQISILARDGSSGSMTNGAHDRPHDEADGAGKGLLAGAGVGALFGLAAAAIPGIGPFITAGTLLSGLGAGLGGAVAGAVVGGAAGSLAGTLAQAGYTEKEAGYYGERVENGSVLVAVDTNGAGNESAIRDALMRHGGSMHGMDGTSSGMSSGSMGTMATGTGLGAMAGGTVGGMSRDSTMSGSSSLSSGTSLSSGAYSGDLSTISGDRLQGYESRYSGYTRDQATSRLTDLDSQLGRSDLDETQRLQLLEERLFVEKYSERVGSVEIGKHVETHQQTVSVPLTHTEIVVERHAVTNPTPVEGNVTLGSDSQTIRVDLEAERAQVRKEAYVTEEVEIGKREVSQTQTFTETVGREVLDVNRTGDVNMGADGTTTGLTNTGGMTGTVSGRDDRNLLERAGDAISEGVDRLDGKNDRNR